MKSSAKSTSVIIIFLFFNTILSAQEWMKNIPNKKDATFYDIQKAFNDYWKNETPSAYEQNNKEEGGYQQFKRWENFMEPRVYPSGKFNSLALWDEYHKQISKSEKQKQLKTANN